MATKILQKEFHQDEWEKSIDVPALRISQIVRGQRAVTADTGLRLSKYFGLNDGYWLRLQARFDEQVAKEQLAKELARIAPYAALA